MLLGKKGKKKKGKTLNLNEFLSTGDSKQAATFAKKKAVDIEDNEANAGKEFEHCQSLFYSLNICI